MALLGITSASAMGFGGGMMNNLTPDEIATRQTAMFTQQASFIGATVDEVKDAWANSKDLLTLAKEKGITEDQLKTKIDAQRLDQMKTQLTTLVSKGVITQAQADKRLTTMQSKATNGKKIHGGMRGMMGGFGF